MVRLEHRIRQVVDCVRSERRLSALLGDFGR